MDKKREKRVPVTIQHVAKRLGVSVQTVSAILGTKAHLYRDETRERVMKAARELGYRPNALAKATRTGRSGNIALLISSDSSYSPTPTELLYGIEQSATDNQLQMFISRLPDEKLTDAGYVPRVLREWFADGMLINYHFHIPPKMIELVRANDVPSVWINSPQPDDAVYPDEEGAGAEAVRMLIERGHKKIAYINFIHGSNIQDEHFSVAHRQAGYLKAMKAAGLKPMLHTYTNKVMMNERLNMSRKIMQAADRPTGIVTYNQSSANPIFMAGLESGLVPEKDFSIVTFDNQPIRLCSIHNTTTLLVPNLEMGRLAVEMLVKKVANPQERLPAAVVPFRKPT
jgi:LacI family transcriptional regulator